MLRTLSVNVDPKAGKPGPIEEALREVFAMLQAEQSTRPAGTSFTEFSN